jgi:hypothetical protein
MYALDVTADMSSSGILGTYETYLKAFSAHEACPAHIDRQIEQETDLILKVGWKVVFS